VSHHEAGVIHAPRVFVDPEAAEAALTAPRARLRLAGAIALRVFYVVAALALFVLALQILKTGAGGLKPVLRGMSADGTPGLLGFGWLGSYLVMSGSPVAAIALSLFSGGTISDTETFAMINGTRLGASFIVLFVGFLYYVGRKRDPDSIYIGVVALLTALTLWTPVIPIGSLVLRRGWFDGVRIGSPGALTSIVNVVYDPITTRAHEHLPDLALFALGIPALLGAFMLFDRVLPNLDAPSPAFERFSRLSQHRLAMFAFGCAVTLLTLSVSLSLTILVPLTMKGYVKRQHLIPYIMGANITTWIDTLFASLLLNTPHAFTIVFTEMVVGGGVSLIVLLFVYPIYSRMILTLAHRITARRRNFIIFLALILATPGVLLVV
jgi:sodium-dependent phosphate cotransporter